MEARDVAEFGSDPAERPPPPALFRELNHIVLQHLREQGFKETAHSLERETRLYLDAEHVADLVRRGAWDEAERYIRAFAGGAFEDPCSDRIFLALRRRKDIEALERRVISEEGELLVRDLKAVAPYDEEAAKLVAALENFRQRERLDTASARDAIAVEIKKLIEANPLFQDKLQFPSFENPRLLVLINQSLNYQHSLCKKKKNPEVSTLFSDHSCDSEIIHCKKPEQIAKKNLKPKEIAKPVGIVSSAACARCTTQFAGRMTNATRALPHRVVAKEAPRIVHPPNTAAFQKHPMIPTSTSGIGYPMKRISSRQPDKVVSLLYTNDGMSLLALSSNAMLWKWQYNDTNDRELWQLANKIVMQNDTSHGNTEDATACMALSKNGLGVLSASGGKLSALNMMTFTIDSDFKAPPLSVTFIVFNPQDNTIIALGMEDSTIQIVDLRVGKFIKILEGHHKKITGLSFSQLKNVLVSSGADAQIFLLCVWSIVDWEKKYSRYMIQHPNHSGALDGDTRVQFHNDCQHLLAVNESQLAIYDWNLKCSSLWSPGNGPRSRISSAVFSCDGLLVYAAFCDDTIKIFQGDLNQVFLDADLSGRVQRPLSSVGRVYPIIIAAHPSEPN